MNTSIQVTFQGTNLFVVDHNGVPYVPMKPVVEGMGIAWQPQHRKIAENSGRWGVTEMVIPSSGGEQETTCLPLRKLPGWLMTVHPNKIKDAIIRAKIIAYQNECDDILWDAWQKKAGGSLITIAQQGEIATRIAEHFPDGKQRPMAWSRFNNHFRIASYKNLPASRFEEACAYIANIAPKELPMNKAIDVRALLTKGMSEPTVKLPDHIMQAVNQRAFAMAHEAYELSKEHLLKQIAYKCEICNPRVLAEDKALELIDKTTLGSAIAHTYHTELEQAARTARYLLERVTDCHASISNALN